MKLNLDDRVWLLGLILACLVPLSVFAQDVQETQDSCAQDETGYCIELREPLAGTSVVRGDNGVELISNYIGIIYTYAASIIGILCVLIIVYSGVEMSLGGFDEGLQKNSVRRIINSILSLVLLFGIALILRTVNPGFFIVS